LPGLPTVPGDRYPGVVTVFSRRDHLVRSLPPLFSWFGNGAVPVSGLPRLPDRLLEARKTDATAPL